jgi:hypothetical protein
MAHPVIALSGPEGADLMGRVWWVLGSLVAVGVAYFYVALTWSYSSGERAGWVQKVTRKGWVCKTWEGELALVAQPGAAVEKFYFTIPDEEVAQQVAKAIGRRVSLRYEEKVGLPTSCFGDTRHFVVGLELMAEVPLVPGVSMPAPPPPAASSP